MKLPIVYEADPQLRQPSERVEKITPKIRKLVDDLFETMNAAGGVGLAAPQVGVRKRVLVIDMRTRGFKPLALVNPAVVYAAGEQMNDEGCLSCPGLYGSVRRAAEVVVAGMDPAGNSVSIEADKMFAVALQHEIDHLDGILFIDRLEPAERIKVEQQRQATRQL